MKSHLLMMLAYKAWANKLTFDAVAALPDGEAELERTTRWESIAYTLSHVAVVDDIFRCHLQGVKHSYTFRNVTGRLPVSEIRDWQQSIDDWYLTYFTGLDDKKWNQDVAFEFVGGGSGCMTQSEILAHVVNHGTYHRGLVSDMLCHVPADMPANDLPVFLRDVWRLKEAH